MIGAICASAVLYVIATGKAGFSLSDGFAANGYGDHSPAGYILAAAIVIEILLTLRRSCSSSTGSPTGARPPVSRRWPSASR